MEENTVLNDEVENKEVEEVTNDEVEVYDDEDYYEEEQITREELLAEVEAVYQEMDIKTARTYQRKWRQFDSWQSAYDDEINEKFFAMVDYPFTKIKDDQKKNEEAKLELIEKAKHELGTKNLSNSTKVMSELMDAWKQVRSAGRDKDDLLWEEFNNARQAFYDLKAKHYSDMQEKFANSKKIKEELIEEVKVLKDSTDYKNTTNRLNEVMNAWKAAGSSGRDHDDTLWTTFNDLRQVFYDNKKKHFASLDEKYKENNVAKKALIEEVQALVDQKYYSRENTEIVKSFNVRWKEIGFSGKEHEDTNWKNFKMLTDLYFDELTKYHEERAEAFKQRQIERKSYLQDQIERQKRRIEKIKYDISISMSEWESNQLEIKMEEVKQYIQEIEAELKELI